MGVNLPNIQFKKSTKNPTVDSNTSEFELPFYKDEEYFINFDNFVNFVKAVERMVRTSNAYKRYIKYLIEDIGLTVCQVLPNVDGESATVEFHHGPILTLFDYTAIITDYLLAHEKKINTFIVANIVLEEHRNNIIQGVMLSKTVHELVHDNAIFINTKQAFGDLNKFLTKYRDGINENMIEKINRYIEKCNQYESFDNDILKISGFVKSWKKQYGD